MEAETHDVRRDFVREARTREYFLEHGYEARGVRLFVRSPGARRPDLCYVLRPRFSSVPHIALVQFSHPLSMCSTRERRVTAEEHREQALIRQPVCGDVVPRRPVFQPRRTQAKRREDASSKRDCSRARGSSTCRGSSIWTCAATTFVESWDCDSCASTVACGVCGSKETR